MPTAKRTAPFIHLPLCVVLLCLFHPLTAPAAELAPFNTVDQSPLVQIYGLPAPESAHILKKGEYFARIAVDGANNFAESERGGEAILLDGESWRTTLTLRRGVGHKMEAGIEIPFLSQSGGVTDGFIEGWHDFFSLPEGGRKEAPRGRLSYIYLKDGRVPLDYRDAHFGLADLRLTAGMELYEEGGRSLALRAALKLPTGDSARLLGSGSTDFALWVSAQQDLAFGRHGVAFFGSAGALAKTRGDVLAEQERAVVGFGSLGAGWSPWRQVAFKVQLSGHTPCYDSSSLPELNAFSLSLLTGGTIAFSGKTSLDIGVSEDILVLRSPDVALHLALSRRF